MTSSSLFKALVVEAAGNGSYARNIRQKTVSDLPPHDVLIQVKFSSLNYKDALSCTGNRGVTKAYPHTPGIDAAGIVKACDSGRFTVGDKVLVTGYDLGMNTPGGFGRYIRVPGDWPVALPPGLSLKESMIYGTAGFTAGLMLDHLMTHLKPGDGEILVTGASGGVGGFALAMLAHCGFRVVAVSGKPQAADYLRSLGARRVIGREAAVDDSDRPLLKGLWRGVADTVGGRILATAVRSTRPYGVVTLCGMVGSPDLPLNVFPFILRGVRLIGIDSQNCPMAHRRRIWRKLAQQWRTRHLVRIANEIALEELDAHIDRILQGTIVGRTVVNLDA